MSGRPPLDWPARLQIALDVACALEYLHEVAQPPVIHGDLKSSNILLDFDFKVSMACVTVGVGLERNYLPLV